MYVFQFAVYVLPAPGPDPPHTAATVQIRPTQGIYHQNTYHTQSAMQSILFWRHRLLSGGFFTDPYLTNFLCLCIIYCDSERPKSRFVLHFEKIERCYVKL